MSSSINFNSAQINQVSEQSQQHQQQGQGFLGQAVSAIKNCNKGLVGLGLLMLAGQASSASLSKPSKPTVYRIVNDGSSTVIKFAGNCNATNAYDVSKFNLQRETKGTYYKGTLNPNSVLLKDSQDPSCKVEILSMIKTEGVNKYSSYGRLTNSSLVCQNLFLENNKPHTIIPEDSEPLDFPCKTDAEVIKFIDKPRITADYHTKTDFMFQGKCDLHDTKTGIKLSKQNDTRVEATLNPNQTAIVTNAELCTLINVDIKDKASDKYKSGKLDNRRFKFNETCYDVRAVHGNTYGGFARAECKPRKDIFAKYGFSESEMPPIPTPKPKVVNPPKSKPDSFGTQIGKGIGLGLAYGAAGMLGTVGLIAGAYKIKVLIDRCGEQYEIDLTPSNQSIEEYNTLLQQEAYIVVESYLKKHIVTEHTLHKLWDSLIPVKQQLSNVTVTVDSSIDESDDEFDDCSEDGFDTVPLIPREPIDFGNIFVGHIFNILEGRIGEQLIQKAEESYVPQTDLERYISSSDGRYAIADFMLGAKDAFVDAGTASINYVLQKLV